MEERKNLDTMTPRDIVAELDKYIVGQGNAKKAIALALRNRVRRKKLSEDLRDEVTPKNIIMMGPTGVGKTEIARRISKLSGAPFIKVEATKFTEVGYVGRDVESMVRDLMHKAVQMVKEELSYEIEEKAREQVEERILDALLGGDSGSSHRDTTATEESVISPDTRESFRKRLRDGKFDNKQIEVNISPKTQVPSMEILTNPADMESALNSIGSIFGSGGKKKRRKITVLEAQEILLQEEMDQLVDTEKAVDIAKDRVENMGIIFVDEIDKIASGGGGGNSSADVSREGVQRDILPIVEGSQVNTKYGLISTNHILFIAAGAFHMSKPSDLIPELQGRFPIRVELDALHAKDFERILQEPKNSLLKQYAALFETEEVSISFEDDAIHRISEIAASVNTKTDNIGARRLHTVMEHLLEDLSFNATELKGQTIPITKSYVDERLSKVEEDQDLSRYIL